MWWVDGGFYIDTHTLYAPEAESKEKHGVWDPMPELTINSPYVHPESTPTHLP
jgi:hypothetical protein